MSHPGKSIKSTINFFLLAALFLLAAGGSSYAQSCDCPGLDDCGSCSGGLSSLTVEYTGLDFLNSIEAEDGDGNSLGFSGGSTLTFFSQGYPAVPFAGDEVTITARFLVIFPINITINTSCSESIFQGSTYEDGDFVILGGESVGGGMLCCQASDQPTNPPIISSCPSDIVVSADGSCEAIATWTPPTAINDNCGNSDPADIQSPFSSGDTFTAGTTTVTYTATDDYGNTATCSFDVTVEDNIDPEITDCPNNKVTAEVDDGSCTVAVFWTEPVPSDNCSIDSFTSNFSPGDMFPVGKTEIIYTAVDNDGNTASCSFDVQVKAKGSSALSACPSDIIISSGASCGNTVSWTPPTAGCTSTLTSTHDPGDFFSVGTTEVIYTATDSEGDTETCSFNVTVNDITDPVFTACPANINIDANGSCEAIVTWTAPTASDNCDGSITPASSHNPGDVFGLGTTTVTYTATDGDGNTATCSFDVIVTDNTVPVFSNCPSDIVANANSSCQAVVSWTVPSVVDNCTTSITPTNSHSPGDTFPLGTTTVTYTAFDAAGNEATCSFNVTIEDNAGPDLSGCPSNILVSASTSSCGTVVNWVAPTADDNCSSAAISSSHNSGDTFPVGTTPVTITATDDEGNTTMCMFNVVVNDDTGPVFTGCPSDVTVFANGSCEASASWGTPGVSDNCSVIASGNFAPGDDFPIGTTPVTYTATDPTGNESICSFNVIVVDNSDPIFSNCPTDINLTANASCQAIASWSVPSVNDNCDTSITPSGTHSPGNLFGLGTTTVTYTATDAAGNVATCSFNVTVTDNDDPVFANCPSDIIINANASCVASATWTVPTVSDNCTGSITPTGSHNSGDSFSLGTTTVTYTALDATGNVTTCSFEVTVVDDTAPSITSCPSDIVVSTSASSCGAIVNWPSPVADDNCGTTTYSSSHSSGNTFPVGATTVSITATDDAGNSSVCSFVVTVNDETAPVFSVCPSELNLVADDACQAIGNWAAPTVEDNCTVNISSTHNPGATFNIGTTTVIYTATDDAGNEATCSFNVFVADERDPVIDSCPSDLTVAVGANCLAIVNWTAPEVSDCSNVTVSSTHSPGDTFALGETEVAYTFTDANGRTATCSFFRLSYGCSGFGQ